MSPESQGKPAQRLEESTARRSGAPRPPPRLREPEPEPEPEPEAAAADTSRGCLVRTERVHLWAPCGEDCKTT